MNRVTLRAHAKVNYALEVVGLRPDGYHDIRSVMQSVSLHDEVRVEKATEGLSLVVEPGNTDTGPAEKNTACLAWEALRRLTGEGLPVRVTLRKRVPSGAGLGGGSADAAAVLAGLDALFGLGLSREELGEAGAEVGADVPFVLSGGTALAEGVGERLTPLPAPPEHWLVVAKPEAGADTGAVYRAHDAQPRGATRSAEPVIEALRSGDLGALGQAVGNDLSPVTARVVPEVEGYAERLVEAGALGAAMTGTGTAVFGIFADRDAARSAAGALGAPFCEVCRPVGRGVEVVRGDAVDGAGF